MLQYIFLLEKSGWNKKVQLKPKWKASEVSLQIEVLEPKTRALSLTAPFV